MSQNQILSEVKKAIDFFMDKTYDESAFYSHVLAIIRDNSDTGQIHREQLERLMFKVEEMRENQRLYWGGQRSKLGLCKLQETEMDKKISNLKLKGYNSDRYKNHTHQNKLFDGT